MLLCVTSGKGGQAFVPVLFLDVNISCGWRVQEFVSKYQLNCNDKQVIFQYKTVFNQ